MTEKSQESSSVLDQIEENMENVPDNEEIDWKSKFEESDKRAIKYKSTSFSFYIIHYNTKNVTFHITT